MSDQPRPISKSKQRAIVEWPCDGIPRYVVEGSVLAIKVPYSTAYAEIFALSGGTLTDELAPGGKKARVHTKESMRRLAQLNRLYVGHGIRMVHAQKAAQDLLPKPVEQAPVAS